MKKFIITESEKNKILNMYGLITESIDYELLNYGNNYIDGNGCNKIYNDLSSFQSEVESGQVQMSSQDKSELDSNLKKMKMAKDFACGTIKTEMKKEFSKQSEQSPEKLKTYMCWFAQNITHTSLSSCSSTPISKPVDSPKVDMPINNPKIDTPKIDTPKIDAPPSSKSLYDRMSTPLEYNKNLRSGANSQGLNQQRTKTSTITTNGTISTSPKWNTISSKPKN